MNTLSSKRSKKRILLAEDEKFWADFLKFELKAAQPNIEIVHVYNGQEAVEYVKRSLNLIGKDGSMHESQEPYDAIITDIRMPIMDGCTAVRIIRDLLYTGPIIVWSAYRNSAEDLKQALDIPVSGFCVKEGRLQNLIMHLKNLRVID